MANLNQLLSTQGETHLHPKTHITPISVMWSIRQAVMGDHVPLENPPFKKDKPLKNSDYEAIQN